MLHPGSDLFSCWCGWVVTMNVLFIETVGTSFVLTRGELLCPLVHWDPVIHYHPLGIALCVKYNFMLGKILLPFSRN
jgi:hypothetical protein